MADAMVATLRKGCVAAPHLGRDLNRVAPSPEPLKFSPLENPPPGLGSWPPEQQTKRARPHRARASYEHTAPRFDEGMAAWLVRWLRGRSVRTWSLAAD